MCPDTRRRLVPAAAVFALFTWASAGLLPAVPASAHEGATGVVKDRMETMKSMRDDVKAVAAGLKGEQAYDPEFVRQAAARIRDHGGEAMTRLFPEGSMGRPSDANAEVWQQWPRFEALARRLSKEADALAAAADDPAGDGGTAFQALTATCKACHDVFRERR